MRQAIARVAWSTNLDGQQREQLWWWSWSFQARVLSLLCCRDDARNVLAAMTAELGPQYLPFVLDVVESALPQKGYMGHIHGYTLHYILEAVGKVDSGPTCTLLKSRPQFMEPQTRRKRRS